MGQIMFHTVLKFSKDLIFCKLYKFAIQKIDVKMKAGNAKSTICPTVRRKT